MLFLRAISQQTAQTLTKIRKIHTNLDDPPADQQTYLINTIQILHLNHRSAATLSKQTIDHLLCESRVGSGSAAFVH